MGPKPRLRSVFGIGSLVDRDVDGIASASLPAGAGSSATAACYAVPSVPADRVYRTEDHQYYRGSDDEIAAVTALYLYLYLNDNVHDVESGVITIKHNAASAWNGAQFNFRKQIRK